MVEQMFDANPSGAGIAWRELETIDGKDEIVVKWEKGLSRDEIKQMCQAAPIPYVAHFRIPTCGVPRKDLCHPFPISKDVPDILKGTIRGYVLFHNGHWGQWKETMLNGVTRGFGKIPAGKWSDSRAMAWAAAHYGLGILELIDEKACAFGPDKIEVFQPNSWHTVNDVWVSNKTWETKQWKRTVDADCNWYEGSNATMCVLRHCVKPRALPAIYCEEHLPSRLCLNMQCKKPRVPPSDWCEEHTDIKHNRQQWMCGHPDCIKAHKSGRNFCDEHDTVTNICITCQKPCTPESKLFCKDHHHAAGQGVPPTQTPFCQAGAGHEVVASGEPQQQEAQEGAEGVRRLNAGAQEGNEQAVEPSITDIATWKWARALNPKGKKRPITQEEQDRLDRIEKAAQGIQVVGPM